MKHWLIVALIGLGMFSVLIWTGDHLGHWAEFALIPVCALLGILWGVKSGER